MKQLQRHVLLETVKVLLLALIGVGGFMVLAGAAKQGAKNGLPVLTVLQITPYVLPEILRFVIPAASLFSVCSVFGFMSSTGEMVAVKAMGISPLRIITPILILAYLLSLGTFWMYDLCASWSRPSMRRAIASCVHDMVYRSIQSQGVFEAGPITVMANSARGGTLFEPRVMITRGKRPTVRVSARRARLTPATEDGQLVLNFEDGQIDVDNTATLHFPHDFQRQVSLIPPSRLATEKSPAELPLYAIAEQVTYSRNEVDRLDGLLRDDEVPDEAVRKSLTASRTNHLNRWHRLRAEPHRRASNGFAVLTFAMLGIPIALWRQSTDVMSVVFLCMMPILLIYYPLLVAGETLARRGIYPELSVWLAPAVLAVAGGLCYVKLVRF